MPDIEAINPSTQVSAPPDPVEAMQNTDSNVGAINTPQAPSTAPPTTAAASTPSAPISATGMPAAPLPTNAPPPPPAQATPAAAPPVDHKAGMLEHIKGLLHDVADSLGGPKTEEAPGPHGETLDADGKPLTRPISNGNRFLSFLGKEAVGISAGLGAARGPGGIGKAAAASSEAVLNLQEKNKMFSMQMHQQHANDLAAYRHQSAEDTESQLKNAAEASDHVELMKNATDKAVAANDGQPMSFKDASAYFQDQLKQGWKVGDMVQFAGPPEKNQPSETNPDGIGTHPTFYVFRAKTQTPPTGESLAQQKVTVNNPDLAKRMMVADGSQVPIYLLAKTASESVALNNGAGALKRTFADNGFDVSKMPTPPHGGMEASKDAAAMQKLVKQPNWVPNGDPYPAYQELQKSDPAAAARVANYFGGNDISALSEKIAIGRKTAEAVANDPDKAIAPQDYRDFISKDIQSLKYLGPDQKTLFSDRINKLVNPTVKQVKEVVNLASTEDDKAQTQAIANAARAQRAREAAADRALQLKLKQGEEPGPEEVQAVVDAIGQGRQPMSPALLRTPQGRSIQAQVNSQYPNYTSAMFPVYEKMQEDFTSGKTANTIQPFNTVLKHLNTMYSTLGKNPKWYSPDTGWTGMLSARFGNEDARSLASDAQYIPPEMEKAYTGGVPTDSQLKEWSKQFNAQGAAKTPDSVRQNIREGAKLLLGQLSSISDRWKAGMPHKADGTPIATPVPIVGDDARTAIKSILGVDVDAYGHVMKAETAPQTPMSLDGKTPLPPGQYVRRPDGAYLPLNRPDVQARIKAGAKADIVTIGPSGQ